MSFDIRHLVVLSLNNDVDKMFCILLARRQVTVTASGLVTAAAFAVVVVNGDLVYTFDRRLQLFLTVLRMDRNADAGTDALNLEDVAHPLFVRVSTDLDSWMESAEESICRRQRFELVVHVSVKEMQI